MRGTKHILADTGRLVTTWLGIPFAEPPLGARRFQPPQPKAPWSGVLETVSLAPACPQSSKFSVSSANVTSEDCLYLNIYSAEPQDQEQPRPVMVWLHPGEFNYGSAAAVNSNKQGMSRSISDSTLRRAALHLNLNQSVLPSFTSLQQFKVYKHT